MNEKKRDIIAFTSENDDGTYDAIRWDENGPSKGRVRPLQDGQPISQSEEVLHIDRIEGSPFYSAETMHGSRKSGPSQVATSSYRANWDKVFKKPSPQVN